MTVADEARLAAARCPLYRRRGAAADPAPLDPAEVTAHARETGDPYGGLLADRLAPGALFAAYHAACPGGPLLLAATDGDLAADRAAAEATLAGLGLRRHELLLHVGRNADAYQNRVWIAAAQAMGALNTTADAFATDAWRVRFVVERFAPTVTIGLGVETWGGLDGTEAERFVLLGAHRTIVADADFPATPPAGTTRWLRRLVVAGFPLIEREPGGGHLAPPGRLCLEIAAGDRVCKAGAGELVVTTLAREATPLVRLRTGLSGRLESAGDASLFFPTEGAGL